MSINRPISLAFIQSRLAMSDITGLLIELEARIGEGNFSLQSYEDANSALEGLARIRYDLIIIDPFIVPDRGNSLDHIEPIQSSTHSTDYWRFGLHVIEQAREEGSPNQYSFILARSTYPPNVKNGPFPLPGINSVKAGANAYIESTSFYKDIDEALRLLRQPISP